MFDQNVHFSSLRVIQARGITRDNQFELEGLENVNIIYGRNGVGKSTVGLTIYKLLRPSGNLLPKSAEVGGVVRVGEQELDLKVAVSQGHATLDGATHDYPDFKSAGDLSGYRLALEELINEDDVEFAKVIADETRGGIDLRAVSKLIDAREKPQRPLKLENEWRSIYQAEEACREHQSEVARKEQRLEALKTEQFELLATLRLQDALKASQAANVHQAALQELGLLLSEYPEGIAKFNGGEAKELAKLQSDLEQIRVQIENFEGVEAEVRKRLVPLGHLDALTRLDLNRLEELQVAYAESQRKLEVAQSEGKRIEGKAKRLVAEFPDEETVEDLESRLADVDLTEIDTTYQRFLVKQQRLRETEISLNLLQVDSSSESGRDKEEALRRYQDLVTWCGASDQHQYDAVNFAGRLLTTSSVVLGVWATILGISVHPLWLFGLLVPSVVMGFYMNSKRHRNQETPKRQDLEAS
ncbi:MAG: hypothetical protein VX776_12500, partial [Planctomycetota bacterium]|nr:hypothetical protein [Planctomycetota bacterium]